MTNFPATQSLLPWLDKKTTRIHLSISFNTDSSRVPGKSPASFMVLDTSSAVASLIDASFTLNSRNTIKKIFLLVQKDRYSFNEKDVPLDNKGIDHLWKEAFEFYDVEKNSGSFISLPGLTDNSPSFPLWKSLFYCVEQKTFFHPPCPVCGSSLELCTAENILSAAGLPSYASTLERFLFCPDCQAAEGHTTFFADEYAGARPMVKDHRALIAEFGNLLEGDKPVAGFPCPACDKRHECFKAEIPAGSRIVPFAFYPFRMLISEAMQLQARDFLSLISGAACDEIKNRIDVVREPGRARRLEDFREQGANRLTLFFDNDPRRFLETLYLKLAFLEQISRSALSNNGNLIHPDLRPSLDHYWVNLADYKGLLPYFWNFKVRPRAVGLAPQKEAVSYVRVPQALGLYTMAVLWFNSLLVNNSRTAADIQRALAPFLTDKNIAEEELDFGALVMQKSGKTFLPENIFWDPRTGEIPDAWLSLWQEALNLGWALLCASYHSDGRFSVSLFMKQINNTAAKVKKGLFAAPPASSAMAKERQAEEDGPVSGILFNILKKWRAEQTPAEEPQAAIQEEEIEKTVIMTADQVSALLAEEQTAAETSEPEAEEPAETGAQTTEQEPLEEIEKTVIMNINDVQAFVANQPPAPEPASREGEPPPDPGEKETGTAPQASDFSEDDLDETVIISAEQLEKLRNKAKKR